MDKTDPAVLQALFGQPPEQAIAYLKSKGLRLSFNWAEMLDEAHARVFTVAKAMRLDILQDIRTALLSALKEGKTLAQFEKELTPLLQSKGWWGKQLVPGNGGELEVAQLGSPHRLKTIYQTNMQSAFMAGRAKAQQEADAFPYLMYVAVMDSRTRPSHAALNGKIWRKDHPVWSVISPPNGFNCRCRTRALTLGQMKREGLVEAQDPEIDTRDVVAGRDSQTGEVFRTVQSGVRVLDAKGKPITMWVDPGFDSSPLAGYPMDELLRQKAATAVGDEAAYELVQKTVLSNTRMKAWAGFVQNTFDSGIVNSLGKPVMQGQSMTVGILGLDEAAAAARLAKQTFMPVLYVEDRLLVGKKALRHEADGNALEPAQWAELPTLLREATWYLEKSTGNAIAVMDGGPNRVLKAVFNSDGKADTVFVISPQPVQDAVAGGKWLPLT